MIKTSKLLKGCLLHRFLITASSALIFFVITMLFRQFFNVIAVMSIRPSSLPPALGLMLGPFGVIGCAIGNLLADIVTGASLLMSLLGFVAQFTYGILPFLMWRAIDELKKAPYSPVRLSNVWNVIRYIAIILVNAVIMASFLGSTMQSIGASHFISNATLMLLLNNIVFCIVLGIPIIILMSAVKLRTAGLYFQLMNVWF